MRAVVFPAVIAALTSGHVIISNSTWLVACANAGAEDSRAAAASAARIFMARSLQCGRVKRDEVRGRNEDDEGSGHDCRRCPVCGYARQPGATDDTTAGPGPGGPAAAGRSDRRLGPRRDARQVRRHE